MTQTSTWFISDLHLDAKRPQMVQAFMQFLANEAIKRDCRQIFWGVYDWNQLARGLYDKVGKPHHDTVIYSMGPDEIKEILKA